MFGPTTMAEKLEKSKRLSNLKNLGPVLEKVLSHVGIHNRDDLVRVGWQLIIARLAKTSPRYLLPIYSYVLIGALANKMWTELSDEDKENAKNFVLGLAAKVKLRKPPKKQSKKNYRKTSKRASK